MMFQLPPMMDPGEAILATIGMRPFLVKETGRIYASEWEAIRAISTTIRDKATELVNGKLRGKNVGPDLEYDKMLDSFSMPISGDAIDAVTNEFPPELHPAMMQFIGTLAKAFNYLKAHFPISVERTLTGVYNLPPSDYALGLFEDLLEIVDKPLSVFDMVAIGRLTSAQAVALSSIYPKLYNEIVSAIVIQILDARGEDPDYEPDFDRGLSVLLAVPQIDPGLRTQLGMPGPTQTTPQPQPSENKKEAETDAHRLASSTQKIDQQMANT